MFKKKGILQGLLLALLIGAASYFAIFGLIYTGVMAKIPLLRDIFSGMSAVQILWLAIFIGAAFFAFRFLNNFVKSLFASLFIILAFFLLKDKLPEFWQTLVNFWNSIVAVFTSIFQNW